MAVAGVGAVSAHEKGMRGESDEEQLEEAAKEGRAHVTRNRDDFILLSVRFFEDLKPHHGLIIISHSISGSDNLLARLLSEYAQRHPKGLEAYTIEFVSRG